ncbi:oxygenase MpaB family protein [Nocardia mexicana]|uniref:Uncharacterized protein (DUF2236 family) n=1 Tax=Nocardia mexicana TaxID=279262 RepID=A0A370GER9_9NOCA|nr:oxygenase MpaB family protein [Nocardia mexicana]RDI41760.1 uncharacterized protein (DUF2236 family) [Nocardia mexicana]
MYVVPTGMVGSGGTLGEGDAVRDDSLLRRYLGDRRFLLALPRAVGLQILHPVIAAALAEHLHTRLWPHKRRAVHQIIRIAYDDRDLSRIIRYGHEHVKGRDNRGARYHALHPEVFHFQHATYVDALFTSIAAFAGPLSDGDRERLYDECCGWYRRYGVSARHMPDTWDEFTDYFADACARLKLTEAGKTLAPQVIRPDYWVPRLLPSSSVRVLMHERARELLDVRVSTRDRIAFAAYAATVRAGAGLSSNRVRYVPAARMPSGA